MPHFLSSVVDPHHHYTSSPLVAFSIALVLQDTAYAYWIRYVDSFGHFIEIHILIRPDFGAQHGVSILDEIREEIGSKLSIPPEKRWFTVPFTADPRWA